MPDILTVPNLGCPSDFHTDTPNALNNGNPAQPNTTGGRGFLTAPGRNVSGSLTKELDQSFKNHWTQAGIFYNSLTKVEQQFIINAMRFEISKVQSTAVRQAAIKQINRVSNDVANRVATALGIIAPAPDPQYYTNSTTKGVGIFGIQLPTIVGLRVAILAAISAGGSVNQAKSLKDSFSQIGVIATVVAESLQPGTSSVDATYSSTDASTYDGIIVTAGAERLVGGNATVSSLYPVGRPLQILVDGYRWGKPVGAIGSASTVFSVAGIPGGKPGVYSSSDVQGIVASFQDGLKTFKFVDRFPLDQSYS